jgi:hypothetical protein
MPGRTWVRALLYSGIALIVIGVPTDLIDTPVFGRPVDTKAVDYVIWPLSAALIGLILAIRPERITEADDADRSSVRMDGQDTRAAWGGLASFLAVGCPVCNQLVVALIGTSGALSWWAPVQPLLGLAAVALLLYTLRLRLRTHQLQSCPIPSARDVEPA